MVNMNVGYVRSCRSLLQLQDEIQRTFPGREQNKGFITGYPQGAVNGAMSGHYPDHQGVTYAYDIGVDIEGDGTGLLPRDAEWLANYLCEKMNPRFQYLIYRGRIRGNHTKWQWWPYSGSSPHNDHIHISIVDLQYGEPSGVSRSVTDSTASWGVYEAYHGKIQPVDNKVEPIQEEEEEMKEADFDRIRSIVREVTERDVPVPGNQGSAEDRKKNPSWERETALQNMWAAANAAAHNSAVAVDLLRAIGNKVGLTDEDLQAIEDRLVEVLKDSTVAVDVSVRGGEAPNA